MSDTNERTVAAYNACVQGYVTNTPHEISRTAREWLDTSLEGLSGDARILEIGSGFGHDAKRLNVLTDETTGPYDLVVADAVFHHLTRAGATTASRNVLGTLELGGRFAVSLRVGLRKGWSDEKLGVPRYFTHWERPGIEAVIKAAGFADTTATDGHRVNFPWLHLIAQKG